MSTNLSASGTSAAGEGVGEPSYTRLDYNVRDAWLHPAVPGGEAAPPESRLPMSEGLRIITTLPRTPRMKRPQAASVPAAAAPGHRDAARSRHSRPAIRPPKTRGRGLINEYHRAA